MPFWAQSACSYDLFIFLNPKGMPKPTLVMGINFSLREAMFFVIFTSHGMWIPIKKSCRRCILFVCCPTVTFIFFPLLTREPCKMTRRRGCFYTLPVQLLVCTANLGCSWQKCQPALSTAGAPLFRTVDEVNRAADTWV